MKKRMLMLLTASLLSGMLVAGCTNVAADKNMPEGEAVSGENVVATNEPTVTPELEGYNLLWSDEFDGTELNLNIWTREVREKGWTNNELQEYRDSEENAFVKDGNLVLKAIKTVDEKGNECYSSGKVNSQNKTDFTYGKVVARVKVPEGQGLWPAIWMMPQDESYYGQWPKCGEIDIMEVLGNETNKAYQTIHYGEPHAEQQGTMVLDNGTFASDFHEYSVEWEPGEIRYYIDDTLVLTVNDWFTAVQGEDDKPYPAPFDQPFFVQMNLAVGGDWPGNPDDSTDFDNAEFLIDYVRVYQKDSYDTNVKKPEKVFKEADETGNFLNNGDFSQEENFDDDVDWTFYLAQGGSGSCDIEDGWMVIKTNTPGDVDYSVQVFQPDIPMWKGHTYKVSFDAYADADRSIIAAVTAPNAGWIRYFPDTRVAITTEPTHYEFEFVMEEKDDNNGRMEFNLGGKIYTDTVYITNVRVEDITE